MANLDLGCAGTEDIKDINTSKEGNKQRLTSRKMLRLILQHTDSLRMKRRDIDRKATRVGALRLTLACRPTTALIPVWEATRYGANRLRQCLFWSTN